MINKAPWFSSIYKALIYVALVLFIIYIMNTGAASLGALLTAFFVIILGFLMVLVLTINQIQLVSQGFGSTVTSLLKQTGPILLVLGFIGYLLFLVFTYKGIIESGHVSSSYGTFMTLSVMLILSQIYILLQHQTADGYIVVSGVTSGILYLLNILLFICVNIVHAILRYFTTDGFTSQEGLNGFGRYIRQVVLHSG